MTTRQITDRLDSDELPNLALRCKQVRCKTQKVVQNTIVKSEQAWPDLGRTEEREN